MFQQSILRDYLRTRTTTPGTQPTGIFSVVSVPGETNGMAAGSQTSMLTDRLSVWVGPSYTNSEDDFAATAYESDLLNISFGLDYKVTDAITVGAFAGYVLDNVDSSFNNGESETNGWNVGPYVSIALDDIFSVDLNGGVVINDIDNTRTTPGGAVVTGSQDSDGWFVGGNLNANYWWDKIGLGGRIGFVTSGTDNDAYTESNGTRIAGTESNLTQFQAGLQVSYFVEDTFGPGSGLVPYIKVDYNNDVERDDIATAAGTPQPANDDDGFVLGAGVNLFMDGPFSGGINATYNVGREDYNAWSVGGTLSFRF